MNTQETLEKLVKAYEDKMNKSVWSPKDESVVAYCLCVIARSMTR